VANRGASFGQRESDRTIAGYAKRFCTRSTWIADHFPDPRAVGMPCDYFSTSTTYRRTTLTALSRWGARSAQAFDL
jgi:hypothetical protein